MDTRAVLDHEFTVAAYVAVWVIQLGYVAFLVAKWRAEKSVERQNAGHSR
jgi:hypothetical protein